MVSAYERDLRQPTLETLRKLLRAAGFDLRMQLEPYDPHDDVLEELERTRSSEERAKLDRRVEAWRRATPAADLDDVILSKELAGRPKDIRVLPALYRHRAARRSD